MQQISSFNAEIERHRCATIAVIDDHFAALSAELSRLRSEALRELEAAEREVVHPLHEAHRRCQTKVCALDEAAETLERKARVDPHLHFVQEYRNSLENYIDRTLAAVHSGPAVTLPSFTPAFERASKIMEGLQITRVSRPHDQSRTVFNESLYKSNALLAEKDVVIRELMHSYKELELLYEWSRSSNSPPSCESL